MVTHATFKNQHYQLRVMSEDGDGFEELAEQIDTPKITPNTFSFFAGLNSATSSALYSSALTTFAQTDTHTHTHDAGRGETQSVLTHYLHSTTSQH